MLASWGDVVLMFVSAIVFFLIGMYYRWYEGWSEREYGESSRQTVKKYEGRRILGYIVKRMYEPEKNESLLGRLNTVPNSIFLSSFIIAIIAIISAILLLIRKT